MITNLDELVAYTNILARNNPLIGDELRLRSEGVSDENLSYLDGVISLPPIYRDCVGKLGVFGVSLGYFGLWPTSKRSGDLVESLASANCPRENVPSSIREADLLIVGRQESNPICVGLRSTDEDVVYFVDVMSSPVDTVSEIASNFRTFLLLVGNLHEISFLHADSVSRAVDEMGRCCNLLRCTEEQTIFWLSCEKDMVA